VIKIFFKSSSAGVSIKKNREEGKKVKMDGLPVKDADYVDLKDH
jgi:hypothetical protein